MAGIREDGKTRDVRGVGVLLRKWEVNFLVSVHVYTCTCTCAYEKCTMATSLLCMIVLKLSAPILTLLSVCSGVCPLCKEENMKPSMQ
jgi:hypothetical protein